MKYCALILEVGAVSSPGSASPKTVPIVSPERPTKASSRRTARGCLCLTGFALIHLCITKMRASHSSHEMLTRRHELCTTCSFVADNQASVTPDVRLNTFRGYGRTGNYVTAVLTAVVYAQYCGYVVKLPTSDDYIGALSINAEYSTLDFSTLGTSRNSGCRSTEGDVKHFWKLKLPRGLSLGKWNHTLDPCIRHYFGICADSLCSGMEFLYGEVLVSHIRQGDVFPPNYSPVVHPGYWQPPLDYYYSAINHTSPSYAIFVGELTPNSFSPVWLALKALQKYRVSKSKIVFQSSRNFQQDLKYLLCARQVVESKSTIFELLRLGYAKLIFTWSCPTTCAQDRTVVQIPFHNLHPQHDNQPREWVDLLLEDVQKPRICCHSTRD